MADSTTGWGGIQSCVLLNFAYMGNSFGRPAEKRAVAIGLIKWVSAMVVSRLQSIVNEQRMR